VSLSCALFLYSATTTPRTSPLSLHDALPIFDDGALVDALRDGKLGGAGLDTFAREPLPADSPLWSLPNVVVTPHASNSSPRVRQDRKSTRLNSSHVSISYAVFCLKKKNNYYSAVDLAAWDNTLNQTFGLIFRASNIAPGSTAGYVLNYDPQQTAGDRGQIQTHPVT